MLIDPSLLPPSMLAAVKDRIVSDTTDITLTSSGNDWQSALSAATQSATPTTASSATLAPTAQSQLVKLNTETLLQFYQVESAQASTPEGQKIMGMSAEDAAITDMDTLGSNTANSQAALSQAKAWANSNVAIFCVGGLPTDPASQRKLDTQENLVSQLQDQEKSLFDKESSSGVNGLQILQDMDKLEASQSDQTLGALQFSGQDLRSSLNVQISYIHGLKSIDSEQSVTNQASG